MKLKSIINITCTCLLTAAVPQAAASYTYTYTGNTFDSFTSPTSFDNTDSVQITFEIPTLLAPNLDFVGLDFAGIELISYTFTAGDVTITNLSATSQTFRFSTDGAGDIFFWDVSAEVDTAFQTIGDTNLIIDSRNNPLGNSDIVLTTTCTVTGDCTNSPIYDTASGPNGNWQVSQVPIPPAAWLFGSGLLSLIGVARKRQSVPE